MLCNIFLLNQLVRFQPHFFKLQKACKQQKIVITKIKHSIEALNVII